MTDAVRTGTPIEFAARLIATAEAHLNASEQSILSHANGLELLAALSAGYTKQEDGPQ